MRKQRLATIAQTRAYLRWEHPITSAAGEHRKQIAPGEPIVGYEISPSWVNSPPTDARELSFWFDIQAFSVEHPPAILGPDKCPAIPDERPKTITTTIGGGGGTLTPLAKYISLDDAKSAMSGNKYIIMWGIISYKDIFFPETNLHHQDWCVFVSPNNLEHALFSYPFLNNRID